MGEKARIGQLTYNVIDTTWKSQLGDSFKTRIPERRFLEVRISVTNEGSKEISLPLTTLEGASGEQFKELENGEGVDGWFGLFRTIAPGKTETGVLLFDVALTSYKLRLPDGGATGEEKYGTVVLPLRMDVDTQVKMPVPGSK